MTLAESGPPPLRCASVQCNNTMVQLTSGNDPVGGGIWGVNLSTTRANSSGVTEFRSENTANFLASFVTCSSAFARPRHWGGGELFHKSEVLEPGLYFTQVL